MDALMDILEIITQIFPDVIHFPFDIDIHVMDQAETVILDKSLQIRLLLCLFVVQTVHCWQHSQGLRAQVFPDLLIIELVDIHFCERISAEDHARGYDV